MTKPKSPQRPATLIPIDPLAPLHEFLKSAWSVWETYDSGEYSQDITKALKCLESARVAVHAFRDNLISHRDELSWQAERLCEDVDRLCLLLSTDDDGPNQLEIAALMEAIREEWLTPPNAPPMPADPPAIVRYLQSAINLAEAQAIGVLEFPRSELPPERAGRLSRILWDRWNAAHRSVLAVLNAGVDRYIFPRLGTHPDEYTSRVAEVLDQLSRVFGGGQFPITYVPPVELPLRPDLAERAITLCQELRRLWERLASLRFDSLKPAEPEGPDKWPLRLKADPNTCTVWLDGIPQVLRSKLPVVYLQAVIESGPRPISGKEINERYPEFPADKVSRYRDGLPQEIRDLIDTSQGRGSCLHPEAWKKSQS